MGLALVGIGCDTSRPPDDHPSRGEVGPPLSLLRAEATTSYADGHPVYEAIPEGDVLTGVSRTASIRLYFDRFLLPGRVIRQSVCIRPSLDEVGSLADCVEPVQVFTEPDYRPSRRMVTFRLPAGARLGAQTRYRITVFVPATPEENGFVAFDGASLDRRYVFDFETQAAGGDEVEERLPGPATYCDAIRCFEDCGGGASCAEICRPRCVEPTCHADGNLLFEQPERPALFARCGRAGCHAALDPEVTADPSALAMGLDLYTVSGIAETAIGVTAHQTQHGPSGATPTASGLVGRAMPRVDPSHPGNSYLLYKLLANPLNHPRTDGRLAPGLLEELERLRARFVVGLPMPTSGNAPAGMVPLGDDPAGEASFEEVVRIETWIAHGAVTACE